MSTTEPFGQLGRLLAVVLVLAALFGLLAWHATLTYDPAMNHYPNEEAVAADPDAYVGERVELNGEAVAADPVVIEVTANGDAERIVVADADETRLNADDPIEPGDNVRAFGTLESSDRLAVERTIATEPWEMGYLYAISLVGAAWVVARSIRWWRFDRKRLAFVPRAEPLGDVNRLWPLSAGGAEHESANAGREGVVDGADGESVANDGGGGDDG